MIDKTVNGATIPALGFGTFELKGDTARDATACALAEGYTHIDTAQIYRNEAEVGDAIAAANTPRDKIFLTTKVWIDQFGKNDLAASVDKSLQRLKTDYVDLLLLHWPNPDIPLDETMAALCKVQSHGKTRHIGISNFTTSLIRQAVDCASGPLAVNQVEYHPMLSQEAVLNELRSRGMGLTAYSPLAQGMVFASAELKHLGATHGKTAGQIALRWLIQQDEVIAIPRSSKPEHIRSNADIFDFELSAQDMQTVSALARPDGRVVNPESLAPDWD